MMEHYRCFHCKQVFGPDIAQDHFGKHTTDLPRCIEYVRKGIGGGPHDAYIRLRKDEIGKILGALNADLHTRSAVLDEWKWLLAEPS